MKGHSLTLLTDMYAKLQRIQMLRYSQTLAKNIYARNVLILDTDTNARTFFSPCTNIDTRTFLTPPNIWELENVCNPGHWHEDMPVWFYCLRLHVKQQRPHRWPCWQNWYVRHCYCPVWGWTVVAGWCQIFDGGIVQLEAAETAGWWKQLKKQGQHGC